MRTCMAKPEFKAIVEKLSVEFNLPLSPKNLSGSFQFWVVVPSKEKEQVLVEKLNELTPGNWMFICHPALNVAETKALTGENTSINCQQTLTKSSS